MTTIINDVHIGVQRNAGTTPRSALALTDFVHEKFRLLLKEADNDLVILGDLFDQYSVPNSDLLATYYALSEWLNDTPEHRLVLVAGNHDLSKDNFRLSSFEVLGRLLSYGSTRVQVVMEPVWVDIGQKIWAIPHLRNQELFDLALERVPDDASIVLLHSNYDNGFAAQSDHSLNVSRAQAERLTAAGVTLVFAHEHQARMEGNGRVIVIGNQIPTSIADCLGNKTKQFLRCSAGTPTVHPFLAVPDLFGELDWRELVANPTADDTRFIRVVGDAAANEAADVVTKIAKYRSKSDAFVITNAVRIDGVQALEDLPNTLEAAKGFDVLGALFEILTPEEAVVVKRLLGDTDVAKA